MTCVAVVGTQWGDEGKGKLVDFLTERADVVARYQGGSNAGHTVKFQNRTFILHLIPSGILRNKTSVIGNGVVVDPVFLLEEVERLQEMRVSVKENLKISHTAHVVMPYHRLFDQLREKLNHSRTLGTTGRGIGPSYTDKISRLGIRLVDMSDPPYFKKCLEAIIPEKNCLLRHFFQENIELSVDSIYKDYLNYYEQLRPYLMDTSILINQAIDRGQNVLFEGAQGTFLDVDHGTYPFVTSSNTLAGGAASGCGVGPMKISKVLGIAKAYTTRVGEGPFPTELLEETGELLQTEGAEFGATTGRPRRCGWFDAVIVRQSVRLNGVTSLAVTKLDVLDKFETIKIAIKYETADGQTYTEMPPLPMDNLTPVYEEHPGWLCPTQNITEYDKLPPALISYLKRISELVNAPISLISVGARREETIVPNPNLIWV